MRAPQERCTGDRTGGDVAHRDASGQAPVARGRISGSAGGTGGDRCSMDSDSTAGRIISSLFVNVFCRIHLHNIVQAFIITLATHGSNLFFSITKLYF